MTENAASNPTSTQHTSSAGRGPRLQRSTNSFSLWRALQTVFSVGLLVATILTLWTPSNLFSNNLMDRMLQSLQAAPAPGEILPTATPSPRPRIGIVAGHWGNDSGAVCADGLTEESVNLKIAEMVKQRLVGEGYDVELLQEFDQRLASYQALALVSIHNDSCQYVNDQATGFKVSAAASSIFPEKATRLTACLTQRYGVATGLPFHANSVTNDMSSYHAFREINSNTTAAIIETGFLNLDRDVLVNKTDQVAKGVADGILCFIRNEDVPAFQPVTTP